MTGATRRHVDRIAREWVAIEHHTEVRRIRVTRSTYASSAALLNVHLDLADGQRLRAVYKLGGRGVKPDVIYDAGREAWIYERLLSLDGPVDTPRLLASGRSTLGGHWLLLEWGGSVDLSQVGARAAWCEAASRLGRMHAWGESHLDRLADGTPVGWDNPVLHMWLASRAAGGREDPLARLWSRYHVVANRLTTMPKTLVHGDMNAANVLVARTSSGPRPRFLDWETAGIGPGLLDLASLTSGTLPDGLRGAMEAAYRSSLGGSRLGALSSREFEDGLSWCRLALAVQWLGWAPGWSPPPAHAHDWRGEAVRLALELGLLDRQ